jgi:hypothetical protein
MPKLIISLKPKVSHMIIGLPVKHRPIGLTVLYFQALTYSCGKGQSVSTIKNKVLT